MDIKDYKEPQKKAGHKYASSSDWIFSVRGLLTLFTGMKAETPLVTDFSPVQ